MRVNIYAEELTPRVEIVHKTTSAGNSFIGLRIYLELPISVPAPGGHSITHHGPFIRSSGDDDSSAVTFWAADATELRKLFAAASTRLLQTNPPIRAYGEQPAAKTQVQTPGQYEGLGFQNTSSAKFPLDPKQR